MSEKPPLAVAISALITDNCILLIKRIKGGYKGMWGLPGGKIERNEHVSDAALREVQEESGLKANFKNYLGFVSEHLMENGEVSSHFLLHVCELMPENKNIIPGNEGELSWFDLSLINKNKDKIIPSDYAMIEKMIKNRGKSYYNCVVEKIGEDHFLRKFE
jgi:ADP-ribose pyrophosphatase YjhB (NUDIX family)